MGDGDGQRGALVERSASAIVSGLEDGLPEIASAIQTLLHSELPEVSADPELLGLIYDAVRGNLDAFLPMVRYGIPAERVEPPTAALEHARRIAQRGGGADSLIRGYRLGHRAMMEFLLREIRAANLDTQLGLEVFERLTLSSFRFIDRLSDLVLSAHQQERDRWLANRNRLRALRVRELLNGDDIDIDEVSTTIRYPLRRHHLALMVWSRDSAGEEELAAMERCVGELAQHLGGGERPLFVAADHVTAWSWIPLSTTLEKSVGEHIRDFVSGRRAAPFIAAGSVLEGVEGFRRSHQQALVARSAVIGSAAPVPRVTSADDPGLLIAAQFGDDLGYSRCWVRDVLGPLANTTDSDERMRETLREYLRHGSSFKSTAEHMHLHVNSVKYRVQRAVERRGRPIDHDRLDVEVALLLCYWFGSAVLS
ncbi:MAG: helix-turn-helix domain-containing protein [Mycobacterium kyogaense]|uniref:PucR family transcriptional regulator n=1 Tax=Mycobacterium kyogaense TaxID=2212479 RepID=UPI002FF91C2D